VFKHPHIKLAKNKKKKWAVVKSSFNTLPNLNDKIVRPLLLRLAMILANRVDPRRNKNLKHYAN
jgi:hypothetical protein